MVMETYIQPTVIRNNRGLSILRNQNNTVSDYGLFKRGVSNSRGKQKLSKYVIKIFIHPCQPQIK